MTNASKGTSTKESILFALVKGLIHPLSLFFVLAAGLLVSLQSPVGIIALDVRTVASSVFQVAGTFLALTLPAAQLSNALVIQLRELLSTSSGTYSRRILHEMPALADELKMRISLAWRAVAYAFLSLLLASFALFSPAGRIWPNIPLALDHLLAVSALSSLIVSSFWFLPLAKYLFGIHHLEMVREIAEILSKAIPPKAAPESAPNLADPAHVAPDAQPKKGS